MNLNDLIDDEERGVESRVQAGEVDLLRLFPDQPRKEEDQRVCSIEMRGERKREECSLLQQSRDSRVPIHKLREIRERLSR